MLIQQRRSSAPSQHKQPSTPAVAAVKRLNPTDQIVSTGAFKSPLVEQPATTNAGAIKRTNHVEEIVGGTFKSAFKSPLPESSRKKRKCRDTKENEKQLKPRVNTNSDYEDLIAKILSKQFKVPIADYVSDGHGNRCLGLKRTTFRRALHDPFACNALVLYTPPEIPVANQLKVDKSKILVHVVVDPVVGNILRPHQREGVLFMYECVTGARGDFNGCIMADEVSNE